MKNSIALFLILSVFIQSVSAILCIPTVHSPSLEIVVRDYGTSEGWKELPVQILDLYSYQSIYNHTRIYFGGYNGSDFCSSECYHVYPEQFEAYFVVVGETAGEYDVLWSGYMHDGNLSRIITSEGRSFQFIPQQFTSIVTCNKVEEESYCSDMTEYNLCSVTKPYRCVLNDTNFYLKYDPRACGAAPWDTYAEGCLSGGSKSYCDGYTNTAVYMSCINEKWVLTNKTDCDSVNGTCILPADGLPQCYVRNVTLNCSDGTTKAACSVIKPKYCTDVGILIDDPKICGCPSNAYFEPTMLSCVYIKCTDETTVGTCSQTRPYYCSSDGVLVEKSSSCGCPQGLNAVNETCITPPAPQENRTISVTNETNQSNMSANQTPSSNETQPKLPPQGNISPSSNETSAATSSGNQEISKGLLYGGVIVALIIIAVYLYLRLPQRKHK